MTDTGLETVGDVHDRMAEEKDEVLRHGFLGVTEIIAAGGYGYGAYELITLGKPLVAVVVGTAACIYTGAHFVEEGLENLKKRKAHKVGAQALEAMWRGQSIINNQEGSTS